MVEEFEVQTETSDQIQVRNSSQGQHYVATPGIAGTLLAVLDTGTQVQVVDLEVEVDRSRSR